MSYLSVSGLSFRYLSGEPLFEDVTFSLPPGDRCAIVGANGSGKSTLLALLAGALEPSAGEIVRRNGLQMVVGWQQVPADSQVSLFEFVFAGRPALDRIRRELAALEVHLDDPGLWAERLNEYHALGGYEAEAETRSALSRLGFVGCEFDLPLARLSGGQRTRAGLARAMLAPSDLLLLDEPTNHLDLAGRAWLEETLDRRRGATVLVSHDRATLRTFARRVIEIERGRVRDFAFRYDDYRAQRALLDQQAWVDYEAFQRRKQAAELAAEKRSHLALKVATAPEDAKCSHDFYRRKAAKVARTARILRERSSWEGEVEKPWEESPIQGLSFEDLPRSADLVLEARGLSKQFGDRILFRDLNLVVRRGERWAIGGPNGCGKSTLFDILEGRLVPDSGTVLKGANVRLARFTQDTLDLAPDETALEVCGTSTRARTLLGCLKLRPDLVNVATGRLSAGERTKIALARILLRGANLLLLDEPTNHLEIEAQEALEQALLLYPGTAVVVSHDRAFLEALGPELKRLDLVPAA